MKRIQESISHERQGSFSRFRAVFGHLGIRTARFKGSMEDDDLTLRFCRFRDLIGLYSMCKPEIFLAASGIRPKAFGSLVSFWVWMHMAFQILYVIEVQEYDLQRIIGFLGIYNMQPGRELWLSLAIFDAKDRGQGHGQRALRLLLSTIQKDRIVNRVCGEVLEDNTGSFRFLRKFGFDVFAQGNGRLLLQKQLVGAMEKDHS